MLGTVLNAQHTLIISFNSHNKVIRLVLSLSPLYRWGNWGSERWNNIPMISDVILNQEVWKKSLSFLYVMLCIASLTIFYLSLEIYFILNKEFSCRFSLTKIYSEIHDQNKLFDLYDSIYMCDMYILQMQFGNYFA